jgi:hypothetical protein
MKSRFLRQHTLGGLVAAGIALSISSVSADTFTLDPYTGDSSQAQLILTQLDSNTVEFNLSVIPNPNIGDLRGIFFNISDNSLLGGLSVVGADITQTVLGPPASVSNLGGGNNTNPEGPFDIGLEIGTSGIGSDDIQSTIFTISHAGGLNLSEFTSETDPITGGGPNELLFAVRMTSVGLPGSARNGSSKLGVQEGNTPPQEVPEPGVVAMLFAGTGTGMLLLRRKRG